MRRSTFALICLVLVAMVFATPAMAANLVGWTFDGAENGIDTVPANDGTSNDPNNNPFEPQLVHPEVMASGITAPSAGGAVSPTVRIGALSSLGYVGAGNVFLTSTEGINDPSHVGQYFTLTIAPDPGYFIDLQDLLLQAARGGGSDRGFRIRTSLDGFTADVNPSSTALMSDANGGSQRPDFTPYTIDLSGPEFDNITSAVEFRFYPWSSFQNNSIEMDNLVFRGDVALIPEATSIALLLSAVALSCGVRRRSQS